jgi:CarD family transcriptional regulator
MEAIMAFQVGEKVVHSSFGLGEILQIDVKEISGEQLSFYVVLINNMMVWVPVMNSGSGSLRYLTSPEKFTAIFAILSSPGEPLPPNPLERRHQLVELMRDGTLPSICKVIRDLSTYKHGHKMYDHDTLTLDRAKTFLLEEWEVSLSVSKPEAEHQLKHLLGQSIKDQN